MPRPPPEPTRPAPLPPLADVLAMARAWDSGPADTAAPGASADAKSTDAFVSRASAQLDSVLAASPTLTPQAAQQVTDFVSFLLEPHANATGAPARLEEGTATQLQSAITHLAKAAQPGDGPLVLQSTHLNLTTEARSVDALADEPIRCDTASTCLLYTSPSPRDS